MGTRPSGSELRAGYVLDSLAGFYEGIGMSDPPLVNPVIEAYCMSGLSEHSSATRGTYRSVLRQMAFEPKPKLAKGFPGSRASRPYSSSELRDLWSSAYNQPRRWKGGSALAVIALGAGGGLRTGEIVASTGEDVSVSASGAEINVGGVSARTVPVDGEYGRVLRRLANEAGKDYLFHPGEANRSYHNFVCNFCHKLASEPGGPRFSVARLRSSFVCGHLGSGTPLWRVLELTGIVEVESLLYYSRHVPEVENFQSKALLRATLAAGK